MGGRRELPRLGDTGRHRVRPTAPPGRWELARAGLVDRLPPTVRGARLGPRRRAVVGALVLVATVAVVLCVRLTLARAAARPEPVSAAGPVAGGSRANPSSAPAAVPHNVAATALSPPSPAPTATAPTLVVYVSGRVRHPGVVRLASGSRVQDALRAAGGALPGSDLESINLAQLLADGQQVRVARAGRGSAVISGSAGGALTGGPAGGASGQVIDLNTGDASAFDSLPGVGPVLAQRIVDWRTAHGRFSSVDELDEVSGIGDKLLSEIRAHVRV